MGKLLGKIIWLNLLILFIFIGNTNGGGYGSWKNENIVSAERVSRDSHSSGSSSGLSSGFGGLFRHEGVLVHTQQGNDYLIHHPGIQHTATVVTDASHMSNKWSVDRNIQVQGTPKVHEALNAAGGISTSFPGVNYITAGTCIGAANGVQNTLEGKK